MITTYKGIKLPDGYFVSKTGVILRKNGTPKVNIDKIIADDNPVIETQPIPEITIQQLMDFNKNVYDPTKYLSIFKQSLLNIVSQPLLSTCCGITKVHLTYISSLIELKPEFKNLDDQIFEFGKMFYCLYQEGWCDNGRPKPGVQLKYESYSSENNPFKFLSSYYISSAYLFTYASHQNTVFKKILESLGATAIGIGSNRRYDKDSNHKITIYVIDQKNSLPKFFELHRERLTAEYLAAQNK